MRILFTTFGSLGDIHPYIAVALEARTRGHEPILATSARYGPKIQALGIGFRAIRPDLPGPEEFEPLARRIMDARTGSAYLFQEILGPNVRHSYQDLLQAAADVDLIVTHPAAPAGPLAARKLNKKWVSSVLSPISLWSAYDPPVPPTFPALSLLHPYAYYYGKYAIRFARSMTLPWVSEILDLSNAENLPPAGHPFFEGSFSPMGTLALFSPAYAPSQPDWPVNTCTTGFCFYDSVGYLGQHEADWQAFTAAGPRPLVFTLGSAAAFRGQKFYEQARRYSKKLQHRAILLTAVPSSLAPGTDPDILETDYAPYSELFPLANILVHQGGIGTTAQALRSGVPQVVVPFAHDQPDNAARLRRLGVAVTTSRATFESGLAGRTLRRLLSRPDIFRNKAQQLAVRIREENGPANACAFLEQF